MKRIGYISFLFVLSVLVVFAFTPMASFADEHADFVKQKVMSDGVSVKVTLSDSDFEISSIIQDGGDDFELVEGTDYIVSGKNITFTKEFLMGDTGYAPNYTTYSFKIIFTDGTYTTTDGIQCYNISGLGYFAKSEFVYNGKQKSIKSVDFNGSGDYDADMKKGTDYKISYAKSKRKAIGTYKYTVKGIGKYKGTIKGKFKIIPKKPKITSKKRTKTTATVKWKKVKNCSGYVVKLLTWEPDLDTDEEGTGYYVVYKKSVVKGKNKDSKKFRNVKKSKYDAVSVTAYKVVNGKKYYSYESFKRFK